MKLYLMQHGQAEPKEVNADRPLSEQGNREVQAMAEFLQRANILPEKIFHSGKLRAQQTAEILGRQLSIDALDVIQGINPNDDVNSFAEEVDNLEHDTCLVGHLPFMARLVSCLMNVDIETGLVDFMPASVICMERSQEELWVINWMVRPDLLPS